METNYHDNTLFIDYLSRLDTGKKDLSSEEIQKLQNHTIAIRGKYRVKLILKP